jgi:hypothetical protein
MSSADGLVVAESEGCARQHEANNQHPTVRAFSILEPRVIRGLPEESREQTGVDFNIGTPSGKIKPPDP